MRDLKNKVIVITGASSGIGRATAHLAADEGASVVVLIARSRGTLEEVARECETLGADAYVAPMDVTDSEGLQRIAKEVYELHGHIDAWVNNAAVTMFAKFEEAPPAEYRRVIETNLFGYMNGARAVLPYFREQGRGVLINVSSMVGKVGSPYVSAYTTSKFAVNGWSESLRMELMDTPEIKVSTILAASIDTPIFQHAANFTRRATKPLPPVYSPNKVAEAIIGCLRKPRREIYVGPSGIMMAGMRMLVPRLAERVVAKQVHKEHFQNSAEPPSHGNLFEPMPNQNGVNGGWQQREPVGNRNTGKVVGLAVLAGGIAAAAGFFLKRKSTEQPAEREWPVVQPEDPFSVEARSHIDEEW